MTILKILSSKSSVFWRNLQPLVGDNSTNGDAIIQILTCLSLWTIIVDYRLHMMLLDYSYFWRLLWLANNFYMLLLAFDEVMLSGIWILVVIEDCCCLPNCLYMSLLVHWWYYTLRFQHSDALLVPIISTCCCWSLMRLCFLICHYWFIADIMLSGFCILVAYWRFSFCKTRIHG